jgi:hypothetical protein
VADGELRCAIFNIVTSENLAESVNQVDSLVRPPEDVYYRELAESYRRVRRFRHSSAPYALAPLPQARP